MIATEEFIIDNDINYEIEEEPLHFTCDECGGFMEYVKEQRSDYQFEPVWYCDTCGNTETI